MKVLTTVQWNTCSDKMEKPGFAADIVDFAILLTNRQTLVRQGRGGYCNELSLEHEHYMENAPLAAKRTGILLCRAEDIDLFTSTELLIL